jgi:hypothetical protein
MSGDSLEVVTGRLGIGAIALLGLFLIADGAARVFENFEVIGQTTTWGVIGVLPTIVVTYVIGVLCLDTAEVLLSRFPPFSSASTQDLLAVSDTGSTLLHQAYSEQLRNHELLKGTSVSFLILAVGCLAESGRMGQAMQMRIVWVSSGVALGLALLSLLFSRRAGMRARLIAKAAQTRPGLPKGISG